MKHRTLPKPTTDTRYLSELVQQKIRVGQTQKDPLVRREFLPSGVCDELISHFEDSRAVRRTYQGEVDLEFRDSKYVELPARHWHHFREFVAQDMSAYFGLPLNARRLIQPVIYGYDAGVGFRAHHDMVTDTEIEKCAKANLPVIGGDYTVIVMLNSLSTEQGGELSFPNDQIVLAHTANLLVSFRVDKVHEVLPIVSGKRYSLVFRCMCE